MRLCPAAAPGSFDLRIPALFARGGAFDDAGFAARFADMPVRRFADAEPCLDGAAIRNAPSSRLLRLPITDSTMAAAMPMCRDLRQHIRRDMPEEGQGAAPAESSRSARRWK